MMYSKMLALKSQRAAFSPAAYGPSAWSISSIWYAAGNDSTSGICPDHALVADSQMPLAEVEEIAPEAGLLGGLHLRQVEIEALTARHLRPSAVEHRQRGAEYRGGHGLAVYGHLGLVEVQSSLAVHEERQLAVLDRGSGVPSPRRGTPASAQPLRAGCGPPSRCRPGGVPPRPRRRRGRRPRARPPGRDSAR